MFQRQIILKLKIHQSFIHKIQRKIYNKQVSNSYQSQKKYLLHWIQFMNKLLKNKLKAIKSNLSVQSRPTTILIGNFPHQHLIAFSFSNLQIAGQCHHQVMSNKNIYKKILKVLYVHSMIICILLQSRTHDVINHGLLGKDVPSAVLCLLGERGCLMSLHQSLVKGAKLCLNPYFFGWLEKWVDWL